MYCCLERDNLQLAQMWKKHHRVTGEWVTG